METDSSVGSYEELRDLCEQTGTPVPKWLEDKLRPTGCDIDPMVLMRMALDAGVPSKYAGVVPDRSRVSAMRDGASYYVFGTSGDGKTTKAAELLKGWLAEGGDAVWVDAIDLLTELRDTYGRGGSEGAVIHKYADCGLLVIDDLGKGTYGRWAVGKIFQVLNRRYSADRTDETEARPTIITSQFGLGDLASLMGTEAPETAQALAGRIREKYRGINCGPVDRRLGRHREASEGGGNRTGSGGQSHGTAGTAKAQLRARETAPGGRAGTE